MRSDGSRGFVDACGRVVPVSQRMSIGPRNTLNAYNISCTHCVANRFETGLSGRAHTPQTKQTQIVKRRKQRGHSNPPIDSSGRQNIFV